MKELPVVKAAEFLGVSRRKVWKLVKAGKLTPRKSLLDERKKLIPIEDLRRIKNERI